jgi:2,3,4,5-tetrahydropyridine-2-carboxylate N-succinyltransferase
MENLDLKKEIERVWEEESTCDPQMLEIIFSALDQGFLRVAHKTPEGWSVNTWIKKAILLFFKHTKATVQTSASTTSYDKIPLKCMGWTTPDFEKTGFRIAPGAIVRHGTFLAPQVVVMPSFINTGVFVDEGTMIDTHVRIGSCAQIGKNCHLSDAVGIGGVLEPPQASPVIIEDNCFLGARCQSVEGVGVEEGSVLGMGVMIGASTKIIRRDTGEITYGRVPAYSVVVPGSLASPENPLLGLNCAVIVKQVDPKTRKKTALNDLLRL